jgi:hypothetical protein
LHLVWRKWREPLELLEFLQITCKTNPELKVDWTFLYMSPYVFLHLTISYALPQFICVGNKPQAICVYKKGSCTGFRELRNFFKPATASMKVATTERPRMKLLLCASKSAKFG